MYSPAIVAPPIVLYFIDFSDLPSVQHHFLELIKWKDEDGVEKKLRIYSEIAHKWRQIASLMGLEPGQISAIEHDRHETASCVTGVLQRWFEYAGQLPNAKDYPKSWRGLINLLKDAELGEIAKELKKALTSQTNSVRGNYS